MKYAAGYDGHHAHDSIPKSKTPIGTVGVAGCPLHQAPVHGRRGGCIGSVRFARLSIKRSKSDADRAGSVREVTRWLQPAQAETGAQRP